jgi:hypothetical protein
MMYTHADTILSVPIGILADKCNKQYIIAAGNVLQAGSLAAFKLSSTPLHVGVILGFLGFSISLSMSPGMGVINEYLEVHNLSSQHSAKASGLYRFAPQTACNLRHTPFQTIFVNNNIAQTSHKASAQLTRTIRVLQRRLQLRHVCGTRLFWRALLADRLPKRNAGFCPSQPYSSRSSSLDRLGKEDEDQGSRAARSG